MIPESLQYDIARCRQEITHIRIQQAALLGKLKPEKTEQDSLRTVKIMEKVTTLGMRAEALEKGVARLIKLYSYL